MSQLDQGDAEAALEQAIALIRQRTGAFAGRHTPPSATSGNGRLASHGRRRPLRWRSNHGGVNARPGFIYPRSAFCRCHRHLCEHVLTLDPLAPPPATSPRADAHGGLTARAESRRAIDDARRPFGESAFYFDTLCTRLEPLVNTQPLRTAELALQRFPTAAQLVFHAGFAEARLVTFRGARTRYPAVQSVARWCTALRDRLSGGADDAAFFEHVRAVAPTEPLQLLLPCQPAFRRHHGDPAGRRCWPPHEPSSGGALTAGATLLPFQRFAFAVNDARHRRPPADREPFHVMEIATTPARWRHRDAT